MSRWIARDARPQIRTLLLALAVTVIIGFIPFADFLTYPFRLFVTFIHEGGHAVATLLTGGNVQNLQVAPNGSGLVYSVLGGRLAQMLVASAGYLGAMAFGALLLALIRRAVAVRAVLYGTGTYILALTVFFGLSNLFTVIAGVALGLGLVAAGRYTNLRLANFLVAFLAVQCIIGALFDLRTLISFSVPLTGGPQTDADNMARLTGLPPIFWALTWTILAFVILIGSLRAYASHTSDALTTPPLRRYERLRA
ncbi:MAG: hypothetical protein AVDCRST_MAG18-2108 [uncultured Thermomicrobiales bacterium]|uniref:M50 family peptidase n=1 Tax=uncultured Thermomicrobiales bacterium TaxID=1645740 RepID=A0A6J4VAU3_9BACT|nr:MAG: hypothetical protein AVDCRST_MAG18-2108 [uncultured Thermomicrobiales bacterium]